jgi:hypothetical protein
LRGGVTHGMRIILDECLRAGEDACYMLSFENKRQRLISKGKP